VLQVKSYSRRTAVPCIAGGEREVNAFSEVTIGDDKYLFLLVDATLADNQPDSKELLVHAFGQALGHDATVIHTPREDAFNAWAEVSNKNWPREIRSKMEDYHYPFILVIKEDFEEFDPSDHRFAILWLSVFGSEDDSERVEELRKLLAGIARRVRSADDPDIFEYVESVAAAGAGPEPAAASASVWDNLRGTAVNATAVIGDAGEAAHSPEPT
jgi:hypothetical protein